MPGGISTQSEPTMVERLRAFHPTKIAVEHPDDGKLNERYQQYLSDKYVLTADETDHLRGN